MNPRLALGLAYVAALLVPLVPVLAALRAPPPPPPRPPTWLGAMESVLDATAAAGRTRMVLVAALALLALAGAATLWAWWLARRGAAQGAAPVGPLVLWAPLPLALLGLLLGMGIADALGSGR